MHAPTRPDTAVGVSTPFDTAEPRNFGPVVISVPHAGRDYPSDIGELLAVELWQARALEDRLADLLIEGFESDGHSAVVARTPRLMIDLNRAETDLVLHQSPGTRPTWRARGGLGVIPDRLHGVGNLWFTAPDAAVLAVRLATVHRPYHAAVERLLARAAAKHGYAILIDLHSMPPLVAPHRGDVVIGDLHGRSSDGCLVTAASTCLAQNRLRVTYNKPYAGGYILERHGRPASGVHALQLEIDRRLYLDATLSKPGTGLEAMRRVVHDLAGSLANVGPRALPIAAE